MKSAESFTQSRPHGRPFNHPDDLTHVEHSGPPAEKYKTEIPRKNWSNFIREFSEKHQGWPADLNVFNTNNGSRLEVRGLPLREIVYQPRGFHDAVLRLGWQTGQYLEHTVHDLKSVVWDEHGELQLEAQNGDVAVLCVREAEPS